MERAGESWTDARLDDLSRRVEDGFNRVDADVRAQSARIDAGLAEVSRRIDALQRTMIQIGAVTGGGIIATLASVIVTRA